MAEVLVLPAPGSDNPNLYILVPLVAMFLAWGIGTALHARAVLKDTRAYPYDKGTMAVWLPTIVTSGLSLLVPAGWFLWMAFFHNEATHAAFVDFQGLALGMMSVATLGTVGFFGALVRIS